MRSLRWLSHADMVRMAEENDALAAQVRDVGPFTVSEGLPSYDGYGAPHGRTLLSRARLSAASVQGTRTQGAIAGRMKSASAYEALKRARRG